MSLIEAPLTWAELALLLEPYTERGNVPTATMAAGLMNQDQKFRISRRSTRYETLTVDDKPVLVGFHMDSQPLPEHHRLPADVDAFEALYAFTLWAGIETMNVASPGKFTREYPYLLIQHDSKFVSIAGVEEVVAPIEVAPVIFAALVHAFDHPYSVLARHCARRILEDAPEAWAQVYTDDDQDPDTIRWMRAAGRIE